MRVRAFLTTLLVAPLFAMATTTASVETRGQVDAAPASAIRAAMLLNFVKFVEWPPDHGSPHTRIICVVDDALVADALEPMARGRKIDGRELVVKRLRSEGPIADCHLLYSSGLNGDKALRLLARVKDAPIFTVSDFDRFAPMGGVVHFFLQGDRMRFAINPAAAQRARLKVSSQLLGIGTIVKDEDGH